MAKNGPILIVEDDLDDQEFIKQLLVEIGVKNELVVFDRCDEAFSYLLSTPQQPFFIICDINLPRMNGLEFKVVIDNDEELREKSIPFIFFSTAATVQIVNKAYSKTSLQGFFQKSPSLEECKEALSVIVKYWTLCKHPVLNL
jgi:CheY-like chemotaxis protein